MSNIFKQYPKNWLEAKKLVKNLNIEIDDIRQMKKGYDRSKRILSIIKVSYAILKALDDRIKSCDDREEIKKLISARSVLVEWIKFKGISELK